jgi:hypothetical protein
VVGCDGNSVFSIDRVTTSGIPTVYVAPAVSQVPDPRFLTAATAGVIWFTDENPSSDVTEIPKPARTP